MTPIRLLISDVDGTLVTGDKRLTPATLDAAARLRAAGIRLALTSARPPQGLALFAGPLGLDTPRGAFNGGTITGPDGTVLEALFVPEQAARDAVSFLEHNGVDVWLFVGEHWQVRNPHAHYIALETRTLQQPPTMVDSFDGLLGRCGKITGSSTDHALLARLEAELHARIGAVANVHRSQAYYLDVTHPDANKGLAATRIAALLGIDLRDVAVIGDQANDVAMFAVAGTAIAMGNAPPDVQARAHEVSRSNQEDGWAWAVDRFVLPRRPPENECRENERRENEPQESTP